MKPQVRTGVGVIILKGEKVLVGERTGSHGEGFFCFPGGHTEFEDFQKPHPCGALGVCGEREVEEETGITCNVFSLDGFRPELFTTGDILSEDGLKAYVTPYLIARYLHGGTCQIQNGKEIIAPREPHKCKGWQWLTLEELVTLVTSEKQKTWIPIQHVCFYLKQFWGT